MATQIYVNLPVRDLQKSIAFFTALGYSFNPQFSDETATCMVVSDTILVMLMDAKRFAGYAPHPVADAHASTEVLLCLSCDSRAQVDGMVAKAVAAGGRTYRAPDDHGFMYAHSFQDLDGHAWELVHMSGVPQ